MKHKNIKSAYTEILKVVSQYNENALGKEAYSDIKKMKRIASNHLMIVEWYEKYGLEIPHDKDIIDKQLIEISSISNFKYYEDAVENKKLESGSWILNSIEQPKNEYLFCIHLYAYGDYPKIIFAELWEDLQTYSPTYIDEINYKAYWSLEKAKRIFADTPTITDKYHAILRNETKRQKMESLNREIERLKSIK